MNDDLFGTNNQNISKKAVRKWALDWAKRFKELRGKIAKAGDDFEPVLKELDTTSPSYRLFRNAARKLKRESSTAGRYGRGVLKLVDAEIKHYGKLADSLSTK
ncbi:MAG TPA: hypothetical protein VFX59_29095 [Polyangiales bacterium]|nr:hypothetical protein [Polyangiales bacterium]